MPRGGCCAAGHVRQPPDEAGVWPGRSEVVKCGFRSVEYVAIVMTAAALIGIVMMAAAATVAGIKAVRYSFALSGIKEEEKELKSIDSQVHLHTVAIGMTKKG